MSAESAEAAIVGERVEKRYGRKRALRETSFELPRHGFLLVICDPKVCKAEPNQQLYQFALHLQKLAGWVAKPDIAGNDIVYEWLYLRPVGPAPVGPRETGLREPRPGETAAS